MFSYLRDFLFFSPLPFLSGHSLFLLLLALSCPISNPFPSFSVAAVCPGALADWLRECVRLGLLQPFRLYHRLLPLTCECVKPLLCPQDWPTVENLLVAYGSRIICCIRHSFFPVSSHMDAGTTQVLQLVMFFAPSYY